MASKMAFVRGIFPNRLISIDRTQVFSPIHAMPSFEISAEFLSNSRANIRILHIHIQFLDFAYLYMYLTGTSPVERKEKGFNT